MDLGSDVWKMIKDAAEKHSRTSVRPWRLSINSYQSVLITIV